MNKYIFYTYGCNGGKIISCEVVASNLKDAKYVAMMNRIKYDLNIYQIMIHFIAAIIILFIFTTPIIRYEYKRNKEIKQYEKEHPKFIRIKEIGTTEQHLGLPSVPKRYDKEYIICPKCKSKKVACIAGFMGHFMYKCVNCEYEGFAD